MADGARVLHLPVYVSVREVMASWGCSRAYAYQHLRAAAGRTEGTGAMLRVPVAVWLAYDRRVRGTCDSTNAVTPGTVVSGREARGFSGPRGVPTNGLPRSLPANTNEPPRIQLTQPRRKRR